jgi:hypothetical protein
MDIFSTANLYIEGVDPLIDKLWLTDDELYAQLNNGRAEQVSPRAFRIVMEDALPGDSRYMNLDGDVVPAGSSPDWLAGAVTPSCIASSTNWTELVTLVGGAVDNKVSIENAVARALDGLVNMEKQWTDALLQTDGMGTLGTVSSVSAATKTYTLNVTPFGARLVQQGQTVDVVNPATNIKRGSITIQNRFQFIGSQQNIVYNTADVPGAAANDILRYGGLTDGAPIGVNGLRYMVSTSSAAGTNLHGIPRSNPYTQASGFDNGNSQITLPALQLGMTIRNNRLNQKALKGSFFYTHDAQIDSYKELGYDRQYYPVMGEAKGLDLFFQGSITVDGIPIKRGVNADQASWFLLQPDSFGRVKFADPYWLMINGQRVYSYMDPNTGRPTTQLASTHVNPLNFYISNAVAQLVISDCASPAGYVYGS